MCISATATIVCSSWEGRDGKKVLAVRILMLSVLALVKFAICGLAPREVDHCKFGLVDETGRLKTINLANSGTV